MPYLYNYKINTSYNFGNLKQLPCVCCGQFNNGQDRVDTVNLFGEDESYCLKHWWQHILETSHTCQLQEKRLATIQTNN